VPDIEAIRVPIQPVVILRQEYFARRARGVDYVGFSKRLVQHDICGERDDDGASVSVGIEAFPKHVRQTIFAIHCPHRVTNFEFAVIVSPERPFTELAEAHVLSFAINAVDGGVDFGNFCKREMTEV